MKKLINNVSEIYDKIASITSIKNVEVIAATKTVPIEIIKQVIENTMIEIAGENRVQELISKYDNSLTWDFIGQLQTNKVKYIIDKVRLIHSVDREKLLETIDKEANKINKVQRILIQVNTGQEQNKAGLYPSNVLEFAEKVKEYSNVELVGLMAVTPLGLTLQDLQKCFDQAYDIYKQLQNKHKGIKYLSMGMSGDYDQAIKSGANLVRIGRKIFGERV